MKKDPIDKLFEKKLRDYGEAPDDRVWKAIEASLDKRNRSRKLIPIWWKLGGAAAVLALLFYLIDPVGFRTETEQQVTDTEETRSPSKQRDNAPGMETVAPGERENPITATDAGEPNSNSTESSSATSDSTGKAGTSTSENAIAVRERSSSVKNSTATGNGKTSALKAGDTEPEVNTAEDARISVTEEGSVLAENRTSEKPTDPQRVETGEERVNENAHRTGSEGSREEVAEASEKEEPSSGKSIFDEISEKEQDEALAEAENETSQWSVGPRVAPVYFNSFGQGSPIHPNFVANSKSGNIYFSYGLSLSYNISPKLSIRSGVHKVDYGYDTNDISFSPSLTAVAGQQINNINYALTSRNLVVQNASEAKAVQDALSAEVSAEFPSRNGRMVQQFGYVEVPLELDLALVDSKLGVHLIGGLSSLFLIDNSVTLEADGSATAMGEANNLNPLNFSTNIGFGLQYEVSPGIQLNLEPVFKYQLNTFSDSAGDFNPYSIGVYSGLNFRF